MVSLVAVLFLGLVASAARIPTRFEGTVLAWFGFPDQDVIGHDSSQIGHDPPQLQTTEKKKPKREPQKATTGSNLTSVVQDEYNWILDSSVDSTLAVINNVTGIQTKYTKYPNYDVRQIDIVTPLMNTCKPKVSSVVPLTTGIDCPEDGDSCTFSRELTSTDTYESSFGFGFSATVSAEADFIFAKASASATFDSTYSYTWGHEDSTSDTYTFNLKPGEYCIPSMVHVELECDTTSYRVFYDTAWRLQGSNDNNMYLEYHYCRALGPYKGGQFCRSSHVSETIIDKDELWTTVCAEVPHRGEMWTQLPSNLNQYRIDSSEPDITDDEVPIRRTPEWGTEHEDPNEIFVCKRYLDSGKQSTITIPAAQGAENALMGFIGCVH